jgi:glycosyltransferase involved in cell wall biosynthesis
MKRIVIFQEFIPHYREAFFKKLSEEVSLKLYVERNSNINFSGNFQMNVLETKNFFKIKLIKNFYKIISEETSDEIDSVILPFNLWRPQFFFLKILFPRRNFKIVFWGLDEGNYYFSTYLKIFLIKAGDFFIFYHEKIRKHFLKYGLDKSISRTANNTFHVENRIDCSKNEKDYFLFVGSLDRRKKLDTILEIIHEINSLGNFCPKLKVIGKGSESKKLKSKVNHLKISDQIEFIGEVNDPDELMNFYKFAYCSISYGQAGLSVLQAFAYGVPFLTTENAISGGEKHNIENGKNGFLVKGKKEFQENLIQFLTDQSLSEKMGSYAYKYYSEDCSLELMKRNFLSFLKND